MPHDTPLITTIVAALVLAFIFGAIANRLKMPPLVGYLVAGVCVGPHSPGFIADQTLAPQLAEIGVILLMFGVGLNFSLKDLLSVRAIAIPGALIRLALATALGLGLSMLMGWPLLGGLVFGLALGVSSTVVTLKAMQDRHLVDSERGHIAIGWLVVEDLAMVLALVLIPAFAGAGGLAKGVAGAVEVAQHDSFVALAEQLLHRHLDLWAVIGLTLVKLLAFVGFMVIVGRRVIPFILHATAHTGSRELFRLAVLAVALGVAAGAAYFFGVSLALGAFFAGMILSESELSHRAAQETLPLRDAFGVLFFVSVGMLFDPSIIISDPLPVLGTLVIILFGKSLIGFVLLLLFRRSVAASLTISAALAQIGEFSFILAALGVGLGVLPVEGQSLVLAGAIISIILNPLAFWLSERVRPRLEARAPRRNEPELGPIVPDHADQVPPPAEEEAEVLEETAQPTRLANHVVLIGYGRVGSVVGGELAEEGSPFVLIEDAEGRVHAAREAGVEVIVGNAATRNALTLANVMGARCVVIAIPNAFEAGQAVEQCRKLNSAIRIIARAHSDEEVDYLKRLGADEVIMGEREIGLGMIDWLKHRAKGEGRREAAAVPLAGTQENLLQRAARAQPPRRIAVGDEEPAFDLALDEPTPEPEPAVGVEPVALAPEEADLPAVAEIVAVEPILPPATGLARPIAVSSEGLATLRTNSPEREAPVASSLAAIAGRPAALTARTILPVIPPPFPVRNGADTIAPPVEPLPSVIALGPAAPVPFVAEPRAVEAAPVAALFDDEVEEPAMAAETIVEPILPTDDATTATPYESNRLSGFSDASVGAPEPSVAEVPAPSGLAPLASQPWMDAVPDEEVDGMGTELAEAPRPSPGFRVVQPSEIDILPPEPPRSFESDGGAGAAASPFRSEFWDDSPAEPAEIVADRQAPLHDVREAAASRAAVDEESWLEALERDLFGDGGDPSPPPEQPAPVPQPVETPHPQEDPVPAPDPGESPRPTEVPNPAPPVEVPAVPPGGPAPRALELDDSGDVDVYGRREPRIY